MQSFVDLIKDVRESMKGLSNAVNSNGTNEPLDFLNYINDISQFGAKSYVLDVENEELWLNLLSNSLIVFAHKEIHDIVYTRLTEDEALYFIEHSKRVGECFRAFYQKENWKKGDINAVLSELDTEAYKYLDLKFQKAINTYVTKHTEGKNAGEFLADIFNISALRGKTIGDMILSSNTWDNVIAPNECLKTIVSLSESAIIASSNESVDSRVFQQLVSMVADSSVATTNLFEVLKGNNKLNACFTNEQFVVKVTSNSESMKAICYNVNAFAAFTASTLAINTVVANMDALAILITGIKNSSTESGLANTMETKLTEVKGIANQMSANENTIAEVDECKAVVLKTVAELEKIVTQTHNLVNNITSLLSNEDVCDSIASSWEATKAVLDDRDAAKSYVRSETAIAATLPKTSGWKGIVNSPEGMFQLADYEASSISVHTNVGTRAAETTIGSFLGTICDIPALNTYTDVDTLFSDTTIINEHLQDTDGLCFFLSFCDSAMNYVITHSTIWNVLVTMPKVMKYVSQSDFALAIVLGNTTASAAFTSSDIAMTEMVQVARAFKTITSSSGGAGLNDIIIQQVVGSQSAMNNIASDTDCWKTVVGSESRMKMMYTNQNVAVTTLGSNLNERSSATAEENIGAWLADILEIPGFSSFTNIATLFENGGNVENYVTTTFKVAFILSLSSIAMETVANNTTDMSLIANSEIAMEALTSSFISMRKIAASEVALNAIIAVPAALAAMTASEVALKEISNSQIAMNLLTANATAMTSIAASEVAMNNVLAVNSAMTTMVASPTAMEKIAASTVGMNKVVANAPCVSQIAGSTNGSAKIAASANAMQIVAASASASQTLAGNTVSATAIATSNTAMEKICANATGWGKFIANATAMGKINGTPSAINKILANATAMNSWLSSAVAMGDITSTNVANYPILLNNTTCLNAMVNNNTAMNKLANSLAALKKVVEVTAAMAAIETSDVAYGEFCNSSLKETLISSETTTNIVGNNGDSIIFLISAYYNYPAGQEYNCANYCYTKIANNSSYTELIRNRVTNKEMKFTKLIRTEKSTPTLYLYYIQIN